MVLSEALARLLVFGLAAFPCLPTPQITQAGGEHENGDQRTPKIHGMFHVSWSIASWRLISLVCLAASLLRNVNPRIGETPHLPTRMRGHEANLNNLAQTR